MTEAVDGARDSRRIPHYTSSAYAIRNTCACAPPVRGIIARRTRVVQSTRLVFSCGANRPRCKGVNYQRQPGDKTQIDTERRRVTREKINQGEIREEIFLESRQARVFRMGICVLLDEEVGSAKGRQQVLKQTVGAALALAAAVVPVCLSWRRRRQCCGRVACGPRAAAAQPACDTHTARVRHTYIARVDTAHDTHTHTSRVINRHSGADRSTDKRAHRHTHT